MTENSLTKCHLIDEKFNQLTDARIQLKKEFFGIDHIIDEIIELVSSWYLFPDLQEKPLVINLWGLTGVGKTALIRRISELLEFSNKFYSFDMGSREYSIQRKLEDIYEYDNGHPVMLALDEFQYARTINHEMREVDNEHSRIIWELIDSGKFQISRIFQYSSDLHDLLSNLKYVRRNSNLVVKNGYVTTQLDFFKKTIKDKPFGLNMYFPEDQKEKTEELLLIPSGAREYIYEGVKDQYESFEDFNKHLNTLNLSEAIEFINWIFDVIQSPKIVDCTKAIVFIMGNLDEAYTMSKSLSPDISADEFHQISLKINITHIKNALQSRFRSEQIARLGNIHVIYPALSKKTYQKIIHKELIIIAEKYSKLTGSKIDFDLSIEELIFQEGVFPAQGTRPVFSSINQIITSQFGKIMVYLAKNKIDHNKIRFLVKNRKICASFYKDQAKKGSFNYNPILKVKGLKNNLQNDERAIISIHESGHAVLSIAIFGIIPNAIYSVLSDKSRGDGLVSMRFERDYVSKSELTNRISLFLGGYAAEKMIFGKKHITNGNEDDIERATTFINHMLKKSGLGEVPMAYHIKHITTSDFTFDDAGGFDKVAQGYIKSGLKLAEEILYKNKSLLLKLAEYLYNHQKIEEKKIIEIMSNTPLNKNFNFAVLNEGYYKDCLEEEIQKIHNK
jgi:cell division protease FtsH